MRGRTKRKRERERLRQVPIDELLKDFVSDKEKKSQQDIKELTDEEFLNDFFKKSAMKKIQKYRKDLPIEITKIEKKPDPPVVSEKMTLVKRCQNCYYLTDSKKVGNNWWCACTNPGRARHGSSTGGIWIKSELNLTCWRRKE
ncbi:MAG: hypothetical protein ACW99U_09080 [Candidatus Thorarchaeota archaeon]|jgi:hypothetical protein